MPEMRNYEKRQDEFEISRKKAEDEARKQRQMRDMDDKIDELATKAVEFYKLYGAEDYRYQMMVTFLDVAFQMKDAIALISSVQVATSYLSTAIQFIDDSIAFDQGFDEQLMSTSYGIFATWKRRRLARRAARNNRRRLETAIRNMTTRVGMAHEITDALRLGFENMRDTMAKADEKRRKKEAKRAAKTGTPAPDQSRATSYIAARMSEEGVTGPSSTPPTAPSAQGGAPAPSSSNGSGTATRDIDDIAD